MILNAEKLQNIKELKAKQDLLIIDLDRSFALETLIPDIFKYPNITSQWTDGSIPNYMGLTKKEKADHILAKFTVKSDGQKIGSFDCLDVPDILKPNNWSL